MKNLCRLQHISYKVIVTITIVLLASCSLQSFFIRNLPSLFADRIADTLSLNASQEEALSQDIEKMLTREKHRVVKLKTYLNEIKVKEFEAGQVHQFIAENYLELAKQVNVLLAKYMLLLDESQKLEMYANFAEENNEIKERIEDYDIDNVYDKFTFFVGSLTDEQKLMINNKVTTFKGLLEERLTRRIQTQSALMKILNNTETDKQTSIIELLNQKISFYPPNKSRTLVILLINNFMETINNKQMNSIEKRRKKITDWLNAYLAYY
ncbi:hypothetical protein [Spartinivicinus ruber]|uniref:hypothetical protein n=1 Tax=Spartinivicinus ruber TaxID=2683272 RepID=UPI0013D7D8F7|nr:hypothetical protein [Spartinivicinus ruber]